MTFDKFLESIANDQPPTDLSDILTSLWWDKKGDWDLAHSIAQDIPTKQGSAVHAYLHREEGDMPNAGYWYTRAGRQVPDQSLPEEWDSIAAALLGS